MKRTALAFAALLFATWLPAQEPPQFAYTTFAGDEVELEVAGGAHVVFAMPALPSDPTALHALTTALDDAWTVYTQCGVGVPAREPDRRRSRRIVVAVVAGNAAEVATRPDTWGVEVAPARFAALLDGVAAGEHDGALFFALAQNHWAGDGALAYREPALRALVADGMAMAVQCLAMDRAKVTPSPRDAAWRQELEGLVDVYENDPAHTWQTTLGAGKGVPNTLDLGAAELLASFCLRLARDHGGANAVTGLWRRAAAEPAAATTQDAVDAFVVLASQATGASRVPLFAERWRWPVSERARAVAAQARPAAAWNAEQWNDAIGLGGGSGGVVGGRGGGPRDRELKAARDAALTWLAGRQHEDGHWRRVDAGGDTAEDAVGPTGLALLAFLGDGSTMRSGPHRTSIKRAVSWLRERQNANGRFSTGVTREDALGHAVAAQALAEAFGVSSYKLIRKNAQGAIAAVSHGATADGAFAFAPNGDGDVSLTIRAALACAVAKQFDVAVDDKACATAVAWLDRVTDPTADDGLSPAGAALGSPGMSGPAITGGVAMCRYFAGATNDDAAVATAIARLRAALPTWDPADPLSEATRWMFTAHVLFQAGDADWQRCRAHVVKTLLPHQHGPDAPPELRGSWDPIGVEAARGRAWTTAMLALTLEAPFRYVRFTR